MPSFAGQWGPEVLEGIDVGGGSYPLVDESFTVYELDNVTLATLYTDRYMETEAPNPAVTSSIGNATFYALPGRYRLATAYANFPIDVRADSEDVVDKFGGVLLERAENTDDTPCTSGTVPVLIPNLDLSVTKRAGHDIVVEWGGRVYNSNSGSSSILQLFVDGVVEEECMHTTVSGNAIGYPYAKMVFDDLSLGAHQFTVKLLAATPASPGTAHAWGAVKAVIAGASRGAHRIHLTISES